MQQRSAVAERGLESVLALGARLLDAPVGLWFADQATAALLRHLHAPVETPAVRALLDDVRASAAPRTFADPAFCGVPVRDGMGASVGVLYATDDQRRDWTDADVEALQRLASCVSAPLELTALGASWESQRLRWELAVDAAGIGGFDWDLRTGALMWDDRLIDLFGYSRSEFRPEIDSFWARTHPDDVEAVRHSIDDALASRGRYSAEFRILLPTGQTRWIAARGRVLVDAHAEPSRLIGAAYDSTSVRSGRDQAARVLDTMATGFFSVDREWTVTYLNAEGARILGRSQNELVGANLWREFPHALDLQFGHHYQVAMATGEPQSFEANYPGLGWYEVRALPGPDGLAVYFLDITEKRAAQAEASVALARLRLIAEAGAQLTSTLDVDEAVGRLAQIVVPVLGDWCVVSLVDPEGLRDVGAWHGRPELRDVVTEYMRVRLGALRGSSFLAQALRDGRPVRVEAGVLERMATFMEPGRAWDLVQHLAPDSGVVVPLRAAGTTTGLLSLYRSPGRPPVDDEELTVLSEIAARAGMALDNARLYTEQRRLSEELQVSLLTPPPPPRGLDLQYRYASAAQEAQVGGDWYDAFPDRSGATMLVIGDVVGHDSRAAAAMGQLRGLLRGIAMGSGVGPAGLLTRLDESMEALLLTATATAVVARVDLESGEPGAPARARVAWSNAGHPPPLLRRAGGRVEQLCSGMPDLLLGVDVAVPRQESTTVLDAGDVLLLYTDGLVERRGQPVDDGVALLAECLAGMAEADPAGVCERILAAMLPEQPEDDVAVVAVRLAAAGSAGSSSASTGGEIGLRMRPVGGRVSEVDDTPVATIESMPEFDRPLGEGRQSTAEGVAGVVDEVLAVQSLSDVGSARRLVARTAGTEAGGRPLDDDVVATAVLLTSELVTNALQHGQAPVTVTVRRGPAWVRVSVADADPHLPHPVENPPEDAVRGRGLYLVARLATRWRAEPQPEIGGKSVWFELGRPPLGLG